MLNEITNKLDEKVVATVVESVIENIHHRERVVVNNHDGDIFTEVKNLGYNVERSSQIRAWNKNYKKKATASKALINVLQKMVTDYAEQQEVLVQEYIEFRIKELQLTQTANPDFYMTESGTYFMLKDDDFIERQDIINVDTDGFYTVSENFKNTTDKRITTYNKEGRPVVLKVVSDKNEPYTKEQVIQKLGLKEEFVNRYKLHGYSGKSSGITAIIGNMLFAPLPTGYYFDKSYNFYKWSMARRQFEIQIRQGYQPGAPMISDYDFQANKVIRTDYDGAGYKIWTK